MDYLRCGGFPVIATIHYVPILIERPKNSSNDKLLAPRVHGLYFSLATSPERSQIASLMIEACLSRARFSHKDDVWMQIRKISRLFVFVYDVSVRWNFHSILRGIGYEFLVLTKRLQNQNSKFKKYSTEYSTIPFCTRYFIHLVILETPKFDNVQKFRSTRDSLNFRDSIVSCQQITFWSQSSVNYLVTVTSSKATLTRFTPLALTICGSNCRMYNGFHNSLTTLTHALYSFVLRHWP